MDFQLYDCTENNFSNIRFHEPKNSWAIPSDGSMDSNEEYFWSTDLKLALDTPKPPYSVNTSVPNDSVKYITVDQNEKNDNRKRKYFCNGIETPRKLQAIVGIKDPLAISTSNNLIQKQSTDKRDQVQNVNRVSNWQIDDISDNLTADFTGTLTNFNTDLGNGNYNVSDALLSLPSLTVFKQEAPSPTSQENPSLQPPKNIQQSPTSNQNQAVNSDAFPDSQNNQNSISSTLHNLLADNYSGIQSPLDNGSTADSPSSQDGNRNVVSSSDLSEDCRFQYVLAAATSIATKVNEDTLTYLNQGQSYEIKLKKLGDLSNYRGRILQSVIRICFYERRLQYMEREQIISWQSSRPGDRIIEVDVPLSYGLREVIQPPNQLNAVYFQWDPTKEVGVYIKVNCISTEFTPKKHGGEKGVPFRIQVETYLNGDSVIPLKRLHAAACQIKVFKLKGADRKHKQDREKIMKRPLSEQEKYQPSYDCTVLNDIPNDVVISNHVPAGNNITSTVTGPYSPEIVPQNHSAEYIQKTDDCTNAVAVSSPSALARCSSNSNLGPEHQVTEVNNVQNIPFQCDFTVQQTSQWLSCNRFGTYLQTFVGFSGADMLRMSKEDLIQICGHADGIRLFNTLHSKSITPKLTMYICREGTSLFHAVYLMSHSILELIQKLSTLIGIPKDQLRYIYYQGPQGIHVLMTDDVIQHIKEESMFSVEMMNDNSGYGLILKPINKSTL